MVLERKCEYHKGAQCLIGLFRKGCIVLIVTMKHSFEKKQMQGNGGSILSYYIEMCLISRCFSNGCLVFSSCENGVRVHQLKAQLCYYTFKTWQCWLLCKLSQPFSFCFFFPHSIFLCPNTTLLQPGYFLSDSLFSFYNKSEAFRQILRNPAVKTNGKRKTVNAVYLSFEGKVADGPEKCALCC